MLADMADIVQEDPQFIDLDNQAPHPVRLPVEEGWVEILNNARDEFEVDGATAVFSTWRIEAEDPLDVGDIEIGDGMYARAGRLALDARMTDARAAHILAGLPEDNEYLLRIKFLRERNERDWVVEDKFDPVRAERKKGQRVIEVSRDTKEGVLTGIDRVFYQIAYPVTAVVYGLYSIRAPDPANLAPLRAGNLNCVAHRVMEHFEGALRGQGLTPTRRREIQKWEKKVRETGATVDDVAELEMILRRAIILRDIAGEDIYNSGRYQFGGNGARGKVELIYHNGHAWPKELHFPQNREVRIYEGDVWQAIQEATRNEPLAVWLLGGQDRQLGVDQFVLQDGRTYRTKEFHKGLQNACQALGNPELAERTFGENHAASIMAKEENGWKPTPASLLPDIQKACVEHGHGGLWNSMGYDTREVACIDMKACYPASFQGMGEAKPWFERFGHPSHRMTRVAINGALPKDIGTGFAEIQEWEFAADSHPVIPAWFGKHFIENGWAPIPLLAFLTEFGLLKSLKVREAIISFEKQTQVWLPDNRDQACSVIGKFTQGNNTDGKRLTRRLVTDQGELDFLVRDTRQNGTLVGAPMRCPLGHIFIYYDGSQPQYTHLRASMLAYAHINLLIMLSRFTSEEAVRVATDSIYLKKNALRKLQGVKAYVSPTKCNCGRDMCVPCLLGQEHLSLVAPAQWRDKGEQLYMPMEHASYLPTSEYKKQEKNLPISTAPCHEDPLTRHPLSYLNGGGGSGKTTRAIELFRVSDPLVFTPTHRLAKEMRARGVKAQTYHSFFRWSGQAEWTPERMGQKYIPRIVIWDEVCTVPRPILETFLNWLEHRGVQVICCGDQGQPPPIAGEMPHDWLKQNAYYYEEVLVDYRAKEPAIRDLKKAIRLQPDWVQCREMRKALPGCLGWDRFVGAWKPGDLILTSREKVRDRAQQLLFEHHQKAFPDSPVPLLYRPKDTRRQNIMVTIPGPLQHKTARPNQQELVLNDVVEVSVQTTCEVRKGKWGPDWRLGYAMTVHSSQGLTIREPQKVWIIDDYLQWSNLAYLAVSRVEYMHQLERVTCPPEEGTEVRQLTEPQLRKVIQRKLVAYKRQDAAKGLKINLKVDHILELKETQSNRCAACNIELFWAYAPKDTQQFSVDRLDNTKGHTWGNVRLTCLECNRKRGCAVLNV